MVRKYADAATKTQIDGYLVDWYAVASYEGRAKAGAVLGPQVMRLVGPPAAKKIMRVAVEIISAPGQETKKKRIGDELLVAIAATGDTDAVKYILDIAHMKRGDVTLPARALGALYLAYVDPAARFDVVEPAPLIPHLETLVAIAKDDTMPAGAANDAVALIRVTGMPHCLAPLVGMVGYPHPDSRFRYFGPDAALKCGGVKAIKPVVTAMPDQVYEKEKLLGTVVLDISRMNPREEVLVALRDLLNARARVSRWVAVETLAAMKSVEDAGRLAAVGSGERLVGFWGDQSGLAPKDRKQDPTLAERAQELATALRKAP
jgi:hypothetical protein